jgi:hypothetical protein
METMQTPKEHTFNKYKQNLKLVEYDEGIYLKSYDTIVAEVDYESNMLFVRGWYSKTTSKHINYASSVLNLPIVK